MARAKSGKAGARPRDPKTLAELDALLDDVEAEMKANSFWSDGPEPDGLGSYGNTPFASWLQWVFLPNARERIAANDLPDDSQVGLMALRTYDYFDHVPEAQGLVSLLNRFDEAVKR
jgi:uncharacterized protein YqcC (DUF446 family)